MRLNQNGVYVPWSQGFEDAAQVHLELQLAIDMWFAQMDGPDAPDPHRIWAKVSCGVMMHLARLVGISRQCLNDNPLSAIGGEG